MKYPPTLTHTQTHTHSHTNATLHVCSYSSHMDSSTKSNSALRVTMKTVLQLPPRLSRSTDVIIELRYGMCMRFPFPRSCSATMTCSR